MWISWLLLGARAFETFIGELCMGFGKGHKKLGGRKKGSLNRATRRGQQMAQAILTDEKYLGRLRRRMTDYEPSPEIEQML
jgi:hypothetical protein